MADLRGHDQVRLQFEDLLQVGFGQGSNVHRILGGFSDIAKVRGKRSLGVLPVLHVTHQVGFEQQGRVYVAGVQRNNALGNRFDAG
jgi:hypothetical protein